MCDISGRGKPSEMFSGRDKYVLNRVNPLCADWKKKFVAWRRGERLAWCYPVSFSGALDNCRTGCDEVWANWK